MVDSNDLCEQFAAAICLSSDYTTSISHFMPLTYFTRE